MNDVLSGRGLAWSIWDSDGVVAAALHDMLAHALQGQDVRPRMLRCESPQQMEHLAHTHQLGFAVWVLSSEIPLPEVCQAIVAIRGRHRDTTCICFVGTAHNDWYALLSEAGAHLIVSDLPTLQAVMPRVVARSPFSAHGYHPLTSGLMERLPWGHV